MSKASQRQWLVRVDGLDGFWATKSGGAITAETTKAFDGGNPIPDLISAPPQAENLSVGRIFDQDRDGDMLRRLRPIVGSFKTTISVTPTDADLVAIGNPVVYSGCLLVGITEPDMDAASGDASAFSLEFAVSSYR